MQQEQSQMTEREFQYAQETIKKLSDYYSAKMVGQSRLKYVLTAAIIANGHVLLESVPGLAKTTAAKTIADAVNAKFSRIQCTPDLLPGDIVGSQIYNRNTGSFETVLGPVFANFVLLDEVNRSGAKTQSAMLEAMQERQVTIGGETHRMPEDLFIVIATQNPIEQEGTYPLSEAQTDRFMVKETITYPTIEEEDEILLRTEQDLIEKKTDAVLEVKDIFSLQEIAKKVYLDASVRRYISTLVAATRFPERVLPQELVRYVRMGASPRASIAFLKISKAVALINGRTYVTPDDVKLLKHQILRHRLALHYTALADHVEAEAIIDALVGSVATP